MRLPPSRGAFLKRWRQRVARLESLGVVWCELPTLWDVDEPRDLARWQALDARAPGRRGCRSPLTAALRRAADYVVSHAIEGPCFSFAMATVATSESATPFFTAVTSARIDNRNFGRRAASDVKTDRPVKARDLVIRHVELLQPLAPLALFAREPSAPT
jgi:hypothetical protein